MPATLLVAAILNVCGSVTKDDPAALLPAGTLAYFGTSSVRAGSEASRQTAMAKILAEAEVRSFLHEPAIAAQHVLHVFLEQGGGMLGADPGALEGLPDLRELEVELLDVAKAGSDPPLGQFFVALTHVSLPTEAEGNGLEVGLVAGVELLDETHMTMLRELWGRLPWPEEKPNYNGVEYLVRRGPEGLTAALVVLGQLAIISTSERTLRDVIDRRDTQGGPSLQEEDDYRAMILAAGGLPEGASSNFVRVGALLQLAREAVPMIGQAVEDDNTVSKIEALLEQTGLDAVRAAGAVSRVAADGRIATTTRVAIDPHGKGLLSRLSAPGEPLDPSILSEFPGDCLSASAGHLGTFLADVYDFCIGLLRELDPDGFSKVEAGLAELMGEADLREDILANLHGRVLTFSEAGEGLIGTPESIVRVGLKDERRFVGAVSSLLRALEAESGMQISLKESVHDGTQVYEIDLSSTPLGMAVQPAFAARNGQLVASNSVRRLRTYLNGEGWAGNDLSQDTAMSAFVREVGSSGHLRSVGFSDSAGNFATMYGQLVAGAQMAAAALGSLPVDLSKLPPENVITRHLRDTYTASSVTKDGIHTSVTLAQFQPLDFVPILLIGGLVALGEAQGIHPDPVAPEIDPIDQVESDLRELKASITVYKISDGNYPGSLDDLLRPLPDFPEGAYPRGQLPVDAWGNAYLYAMEMHPEKNRLCPKIWSAGANGMNENGGGDDVVKF